jgi:mannosyltransferase
VPNSRAFQVGTRYSGYVIPVVLTLLAFGLRVNRLGYQSLWRDEVDALHFATQPLPALMAMFTSNGQNGPFFFLVLRGWLALVGQSEFALRFLSACCGALAVAVSYRLVVRLGGRSAAAVTALLMALAPYLVWYGQEAKMYALLTFLVPLQFWLLLLAIETRRLRYWVLLWATTGLAVYTHLLAALVIPVQLVWILFAPASRDASASGGGDLRESDLQPAIAPGLAQTAMPPSAGADQAGIPPPRGRVRGPGARRFLYALLYLTALALPSLPVARWALPMWLSWNYRTGFGFVPLPAMVQALVLAFTRGPLWLARLPMVPTLLAVVCGGVLWAFSGGRGGWRTSALFLTWLLLPVAGIYLLSLGTPVFTERYLIWVVPAFLSLAALGIVALARAWRPIGLTVFGLILAFNIADTMMYQHTPLKSDFRAAAAYVLAHRRPGDRLMFQIPYGQYVFGYYAGTLTGAIEGPYTNNGSSSANVEKGLAGAMSGVPAVWLIASEVPMWDQRDLTQAWLAAHADPTDRADFAVVSVIRYQFPGASPAHASGN